MHLYGQMEILTINLIPINFADLWRHVPTSRVEKPSFTYHYRKGTKHIGHIPFTGGKGK